MESQEIQEIQGEEIAAGPAEKKRPRWVLVIVAAIVLLLVLALCFWVLVGPAIGNVFSTIVDSI